MDKNWHGPSQHRTTHPAPFGRTGGGSDMRIYRQWLALKNGDFAYEYGISAVRMQMARRWKMPIRKLREIIARKGRPDGT